MKIVNPQERTTLVLNKYMEPFGICTARAAFRHLINGRFTGIDAIDAAYTWDGYHPDYSKNDPQRPTPSKINWRDRNIEVFPDQPVLRSAPDSMGNETAWFVPTVVRCNKTFGYRAKGGKDIPLRKLYEIYKRTCQYCLQTIPYSEATKDHQYPKSRGGSNHEFNLVLACRACNNDKDSHFPYLNVNNEEVKPKRPLPSGTYLPDEKMIREEWKKYLFLG